MNTNPELWKSLKSNVEISELCLEGIFEGFDNLTKRKSVTLEDLAVNGFQIALGSIGYYFFGSAAIEDVKQLAGNISLEIEKSKKPAPKTAPIVQDNTLLWLGSNIPVYLFARSNRGFIPTGG